MQHKFRYLVVCMHFHIEADGGLSSGCQTTNSINMLSVSVMARQGVPGHHQRQPVRYLTTAQHNMEIQPLNPLGLKYIYTL